MRAWSWNNGDLYLKIIYINGKWREWIWSSTLGKQKEKYRSLKFAEKKKHEKDFEKSSIGATGWLSC